MRSSWAIHAARSSQHGGLLVARHGYLVYEKYYGKGDREALPAMASVGKAYTSIACGIMLNEKHDEIPEGLEAPDFGAMAAALQRNGVDVIASSEAVR